MIMTTSKKTLKRLFPGVSQMCRREKLHRTISNYRSQMLPNGFFFGGNKLFLSGEFEPDETSKITELLESADVLIDVGANVGFYSCLAKQMGKHVLAFEPCQSNLDLLYLNLAANEWTDVEVFPLGLGAQSTVLPLYGDGTGASLVSSWSHQKPEYVKRIPISTLDLVLGHRFSEQRVIVKIDVEGAELGVVRGATELLSRDKKPIWMIEICFDEHHPSGRNPDFRQVFECLWSHGYHAETVEEGRSVSPEDVDRWLQQGHRDFGSHNYLFKYPH